MREGSLPSLAPSVAPLADSWRVLIILPNNWDLDSRKGGDKFQVGLDAYSP